MSGEKQAAWDRAEAARANLRNVEARHRYGMASVADIERAREERNLAVAAWYELQEARP